MKPEFEDVARRLAVYRGDCLDLLPQLGEGVVDAVVTDPPYSSGGLYRNDRMASTSKKYVASNTAVVRPDFAGDNRDQRGYLAWSRMWMAEAFRVTRRGGALVVFSDWRQVPILTDAVQAAGWQWRGIAVWDKTEGSRPQRGWYRQQCEFVITASKGSMGREQDRPSTVCAPGCYRYCSTGSAKEHIAQKPVALMRDLLQILPPGSRVLDPFAGSGTTLIAARELGLAAIGMELSAEYLRIMRGRLAQGALEIAA